MIPTNTWLITMALASKSDKSARKIGSPSKWFKWFVDPNWDDPPSRKPMTNEGLVRLETLSLKMYSCC